ncbi:hypothetical protein GQ457_08G032960 [Hibiscus cannabinus]
MARPRRGVRGGGQAHVHLDEVEIEQGNEETLPPLPPVGGEAHEGVLEAQRLMDNGFRHVVEHAVTRPQRPRVSRGLDLSKMLRSKEGAIEEKESRNNHKGPKLAWSIDLEIDSSLSSSSSLITSLLIMLVMTCTLVSGVGGLEMHLEAELYIFGRLIQSKWVVKVTW